MAVRFYQSSSRYLAVSDVGDLMEKGSRASPRAMVMGPEGGVVVCVNAFSAATKCFDFWSGYGFW